MALAHVWSVGGTECATSELLASSEASAWYVMSLMEQGGKALQYKPFNDT